LEDPDDSFPEPGDNLNESLHDDDDTTTTTPEGGQ